MLPNETLNDYRQRVLRGEQIPREEYKQVIASLRQRRAADIAAASEAKTQKAKKVKSTTETSDDELNNILGF